MGEVLQGEQQGLPLASDSPLAAPENRGVFASSFFSGAREPKIAMAACSGRVIWVKMQFLAAVVLHVPTLITRHGGQYERPEQNGTVSSHCFCRDKMEKILSFLVTCAF